MSLATQILSGPTKVEGGTRKAVVADDGSRMMLEAIYLELQKLNLQAQLATGETAKEEDIEE